MNSVKILHVADLHMDSPFESLAAGKAAVRRSEQRELLNRLAGLVRSEGIQLVLLPGDLLDSDKTYYETGQELVRSLGQMAVPVFIAPGNHDYYSPKSPYAKLKLPDNVHVFSQPYIQCFELSELRVRVFGAAFVDNRSPALLESFHADRQEDMLNILCIHGELSGGEGVYNPITEQQLADSGMDYVALGHIHKTEGLKKAGSTWYSWPGCPEGRGFDETGDKTVNIVTLSDGGCKLETACVAGRRYQTFSVDITGADALLAIHTGLPDDTAGDIYRIILIGETETAPDLNRLQARLSDMFFELQLRDETRLRQSVWERAGEDTLRGLFLLRLKEQYDKTEDDSRKKTIEQAARWGLAALDNREEIVKHEN